MKSRDKKFWIELFSVFGFIASVVTITGFTLKDCTASCSSPPVIEDQEIEITSDSDIDELIVTDNISFDISKLTLKVGDSYKLTVKANSSDSDISSLTWSSNNNAIASVDPSGIVIAHTEGNALIFATCNNGYTARCELTVIKDHPTTTTDNKSDSNSNNKKPDNTSTGNVSSEKKATLSINNSSVTLFNGEQATLSISCSNSSADLSDTKWSSSNPSAIAISPNGKSCTITANDHTSGVTVTATNKYGTVTTKVYAFGPVLYTYDKSTAHAEGYDIVSQWTEYRTRKRSRRTETYSGDSTIQDLDIGDGWVLYKTIDKSTDSSVMYTHYFYRWSSWGDWYDHSDWIGGPDQFSGLTPPNLENVSETGDFPNKTQTVTEVEYRTGYKYRQIP